MTTKTKALSYVNFNATETAITMATEKLADNVKQVERLKGNSNYLRVTFFDVALPQAYVMVEEAGSRGIHFCEAVEAGVNCNHRNQLAAIARKVGVPLVKVNAKSKIADFNEFIKVFANREWEDISEKFNLLPVVPTTPSVTTTVTKPASTTVPSQPLTSRTPPALAAFYASQVKELRDWSDGWNEVQKYLISQKVDAATINKIVALRKKICKNVPIQMYHIPPTKPSTLFDGSEYVGRSLRHIINGRHLIYLGEAGCGKDTLINTLAWVLSYPRNLVAGSPDENKESLLAEPTFSNGESSYQLSTYAKNVVGGGMINFAEFNALPDGLSMSLHSHFDENKTMSLPLGWGNAPVNDHFLMIASGNLGAAYKVRELSPAFKSRFAIIRFEKSKSFKDLLSMKTGLLDTVALNTFDKIHNALKELEAEGRAKGSTGLRGFIFAAQYVLDYGNNIPHMIEAIEDYILNQVTDMEDYFEARSTVRAVYPALPTSSEEAEYERLLANAY